MLFRGARSSRNWPRQAGRPRCLAPLAAQRELPEQLSEVGILAELLDKLLPDGLGLFDPARLQRSRRRSAIVFRYNAAVLDRVFELLHSLQCQQVPFSLGGNIGVNLLGELLPLAYGGQVILSFGRIGRQLVGNKKLPFRIVGRFAEGGLEPAGQVFGPVFGLVQQDFIAPGAGLVVVRVVFVFRDRAGRCILRGPGPSRRGFPMP